MLSRTLRFASFSVGLFALCFLALSSAPSASADASHIRIIRISYVQGDVRFARDIKGDPLAGAENITWENAELNLPIRQGFVISTEHGLAEVEFENGSLALIGENTVLQFFDLSLEDGSKTTRLILRQGTASFSVSTLSPSRSIVPVSGSCSVAMVRISELLPAPFGPSRPKHSPRATSRSRPSTAVTSAYALRRPRSSSEGPG